jgi:predicted enzyme related to lactoylglutathione lyase
MHAVVSEREFEIVSSSPGRTRRFYAEVLGWRMEPTSRPGVFLVGPGTGERSSIRVADVPDLDACLDRVPAHGGRVVIPAYRVRDLARVAFVQDPDGNVVCLRERRQ